MVLILSWVLCAWWWGQALSEVKDQIVLGTFRPSLHPSQRILQDGALRWTDVSFPSEKCWPAISAAVSHFSSFSSCTAHFINCPILQNLSSSSSSFSKLLFHRRRGFMVSHGIALHLLLPFLFIFLTSEVPSWSSWDCPRILQSVACKSY